MRLGGIFFYHCPGRKPPLSSRLACPPKVPESGLAMPVCPPPVRGHVLTPSRRPPGQEFGRTALAGLQRSHTTSNYKRSEAPALPPSRTSPRLSDSTPICQKAVLGTCFLLLMPLAVMEVVLRLVIGHFARPRKSTELVPDDPDTIPSVCALAFGRIIRRWHWEGKGGEIQPGSSPRAAPHHCGQYPL